MRLPSDQEIDQHRKMVDDLVSVSWPQNLPKVKRAQSRGTGTRVLDEGLERSSYVVRFSCWDKPDLSEHEESYISQKQQPRLEG